MILITGANSGIGKYLFDELSKNNKVFGTYNSSISSNKYLSKVDIKNYEDIDKWKKSLELINDEKIILINCAGLNYNSFAHKSDLLKWKNVVETNLIGTFNVIHCFLNEMRNSNYGRIINFGSIVAQKGMMGTSAYAASKSALLGLTRALTVENANKGITINTINLGYCDIGMGINEIPEDIKPKVLRSIPAGRFGQDSEILNTINYLIETEFVNGVSIDINGGQV